MASGLENPELQPDGPQRQGGGETKAHGSSRFSQGPSYSVTLSHLSVGNPGATRKGLVAQPFSELK